MTRRVFITGVTGQDGSYLAEHLMPVEGIELFGLVRGQDNPKAAWLQGLVPSIQLISGDLQDEGSLRAALAIAIPDEIYHLGGISSPGLAWGQPLLTADVTGLGTARLLQAMANICPDAHFIQAASIAEHGPYGAAKQYARTITTDWRDRGFHASNAVFGGHHSPRRGRSFFSQKVATAAARIKRGAQGRLVLGTLNRRQDWGWAQDFVAVLPDLMLLPPDDYVMSTGIPYGVDEFVAVAFEAVGLDWFNWVDIDTQAGNITDVSILSADPDPRLAWTPRVDFVQLVEGMVQHAYDTLG